MKLNYIFLLFLVSCSDPSPEEIKQQKQVKINYYTGNVESFTYIKDKRTKLCFLAGCLGCESKILTNVPCTDEVEKLIENK